MSEPSRDGVQSWAASMTARDRIRAVAETLREPRSVNWISEQADAAWSTTNEELHDLVDQGQLGRVEAGKTTRYTQRTLHRDVHDRLTNQAGCEDVRYRPSRRRPRYVVVDVDPATFLGDSYDAATVRLEIRFWYPAGVDHEYYRINWVEPDRNLMLGFHQDADHPDLGPCHIQLDHEETPVNRHSASFLDAHPLAVLDDRPRQLPAAVETIGWENETPSLSTDKQGECLGA